MDEIAPIVRDKHKEEQRLTRRRLVRPARQRERAQAVDQLALCLGQLRTADAQRLGQE